jgi:hypothetical protein
VLSFETHDHGHKAEINRIEGKPPKKIKISKKEKLSDKTK